MALSCGNVVPLQDLCLLTVSSYLSPCTFWSIYKLVPYVHCPRIENIVHSFICDNFMDLSHTDEFLALDKKGMQRLLDNQDINVSEAAMLDSLARWYKHSEKKREKAFKNLFDKLHLRVIRRDVLSELIKKYQLVKTIPELRKYKRLSSQRVNLDNLIFEENISNIAVLGQTPPFSLFLDPSEDRLHYWMPMTSKLLVTECPALTFLDSLEDCFYTKVVHECKVPRGNSELFVLGMALTCAENHFHQTTSFNLRFDLISKTFKVCTPFCDSNALCDYISVSCGHFIFFIKGLAWALGSPEESLITHNVHRYDTDKDQWQEVQPAIMPYSSETDCVVSFKNRYVYLFGKHSSEMYDLATNTWTPLDIPWQGRGENVHLLYAATLGNQIYVWLKVRNYLVFAYNPASKTWQSHEEQCYSSSIRETFFGEIFSLHFIKGRPKLAVMNNDMVEEKRVFSIKKNSIQHMDYHHMTLLSRGARIAIEQDKTVQNLKK